MIGLGDQIPYQHPYSRSDVEELALFQAQYLAVYPKQVEHELHGLQLVT